MDIQGFIDDVDALNDYFRITIAIGLILFGLLVAKYLVIRPWWKFVTATEVDWDDHLHRPLANRTYAFIIALGSQLTIRWILGTEGTTFDTTEPIFAAFYVILSASILSVSIKHLIPVLMDRFSAQGSVTVSGSNSIIVFFLRTVVWFAGLYFALDQLGIELFGILASLAVFSLIIGLAVQQTLGNIVNSFLLSIDRPFEVGDRIEVEEVLGSVVSVGILSTKVLDRDERLVVIPNNTLVQSKIVNHARGGGDGIARRISVVLDVGVDYREDIDHVKYTLLQLAKNVHLSSIALNQEFSLTNLVTLLKFSECTHGSKTTAMNGLLKTGFYATSMNASVRKTSTFHSRPLSNFPTVFTRKQKQQLNELQSVRCRENAGNCKNLVTEQELNSMNSQRLSRILICRRKIEMLWKSVSVNC
jgi:small-conductance mechanosensitive channel